MACDKKIVISLRSITKQKTDDPESFQKLLEIEQTTSTTAVDPLHLKTKKKDICQPKTNASISALKKLAQFINSFLRYIRF